MPSLRSTFFAFILALGAMAGARAQELQVQPTPFTTWLDFHALTLRTAPKTGLPIWIESVEQITSTAGKTTFRIRFRHLGGLDDKLQVRLFFRDLPNAEPSLTGWTETGSQPFVSGPLGQGVGVDTSETLLVPAAALDYLDVDAPGDGSNLRGAFVSSLRRQTVWNSLDFAKPDEFTDPFGAPAPASPAEQDQLLYGRIRATLDAAPLKLEPGGVTDAAYEFALDKPPLLAAISFEILDASPTTPLSVFINGQPAAAASITFPDLADPAYRGESRPLERGLRFRYTGWLRGQVLVPGSALLGGLNTFVLRVNENANPVVIRAVEIELKHPSTVFDYEFKP